jgi:hypothetical protein
MPNIKLAKASVKTNYEEDMPTEDLLNNLDQLIQQVIKP